MQQPSNIYSTFLVTFPNFILKKLCGGCGEVFFLSNLVAQLSKAQKLKNKLKKLTSTIEIGKTHNETHWCGKDLSVSCVKHKRKTTNLFGNLCNDRLHYGLNKQKGFFFSFFCCFMSSSGF